MKKVISFEKELDFPTMIGEITSISLDQDVEFIESNLAKGQMIVSGTYKLTEASTLVEDFKYDIPVEISLTENLDLETAKISISNFNYEIINDDILNCKIDLLLEGVEEIQLDDANEKEEIEILTTKEDRECDGDESTKEKEIPIKNNEGIENTNEIQMPKSENKIIEEPLEKMKIIEEDENTNISSLFRVFENSEETFTTYSVYIMRKDDSLDKIMDKYHISREQLNEYNDLENLEIGTKIIIPCCNE